MEPNKKLKNFIKTLIRECLNEQQINESHYDFIRQFKMGNEFFTSLGLNEDELSTLQIWVNLMRDNEKWYNQKWPTPQPQPTGLIRYINKKVGDLKSFIQKHKSENPIKVVRFLKQ